MDFELTNVSRCYADPADESPIAYFTDILDDDHQPTPGKAIFFLETSCSQSGIVKLNAR